MSEWSQKPLGTLCSIKTGKKDVNEGSPNGAYPFFTCSRDVHASDSYSFDTDAILIAGNGVVGETKLYRGKFEAYQRTYVLSGFKEDLDFIYYVLKGSLTEALSKVVSGSTMPYIRKGDLERFPIPLPPLPEQKKIAHILSTVQRAIETQERIIQTTTELKKALMHKLFTEGLRNEPQKQTEIGIIPERWEVVPLNDFVDFKNGVNFSRGQKGKEGILVIDVKNMFGRECMVLLDSLYRVNKKFNEDYKLVAGDLLFVRSSLKLEGVGWTSLFGGHTEPTTFCGFIIRARLKEVDNFDPFFLTHFCRSDVARKKIISGGAKIGITNINQGILKSLLIPQPSLAEQKEIAAAIGNIDKKINYHNRKKQTIQQIFLTLLHELMTAKIRVGKVC